MHEEISRVAREYGLDSEVAAAFDAVVVDLLSRRDHAGVLPTLAGLTGAPFPSVSLDPETTEEAPLADVGSQGRYVDLGPIGTGGMGAVRRVLDRELNRAVAMKTIKTGMSKRSKAVARFVQEAQATSQLQHPNIVPIYDIGVNEDGAVWFTMKEVRGRTLGDVIAEVHAASGHRWEPARSGWTFRQVVGAFLQVCRAVGYAHARGVVHRDLKPENVMVGNHGEVYLVDWGLAKVLGHPDLAAAEGDLDAVVTDMAQSGSHATRVGTVSGTPAYMSPEQARGEIQRIDARSDVYSLGSMLYQILCGSPPFTGRDPMSVVASVALGAAEPLPVLPRTPAELVEACKRAMAAAREDRFSSAESMATEIQAWLDGARRREQALRVVESARALEPEAVSMLAEADRLDREAEALLADVPTWAPEEEKAAAWALQDEAKALRRRADLTQLSIDQGLHGALRIDSALPDAHAVLVERYRSRHEEAERNRRTEQVARAEALVTAHCEALPPGHEVRERSAVYLKGDGAFTLVTDPPGAEVELYRYVRRNRRLVPEPLRLLGETPLVEVPLELGRYLCVVRHPDRVPVHYPVRIDRLAHWDGIPPGESEPVPIHLPTAEELGPDDCYVPAGWFMAGGDPWSKSKVLTRLWCDGLVIKRFPVTNREYVAFLDDLVSQGREEDALRWAPRQRSGQYGREGALMYGRGPDGGFTLVEDGDGDLWLPDWPVMMVNWSCAVAYARWLRERTSLPWRLPGELEWQKSAQGVDGRLHPWGDYIDASWCCIRYSHPDRPLPEVVDSRPVDTSPYGVRGMAGNIQDWCGDDYLKEGWQARDGRVVLPPPMDAAAENVVFRPYRGGYFAGVDATAVCSARFAIEGFSRFGFLGMRMARSFP